MRGKLETDSFRVAVVSGKVSTHSVSQSVSQSVIITLLAGSTWPTLTLHSDLLCKVSELRDLLD